MAETLISNVPMLAPYSDALRAIGYRNTDQLVGAGSAAQMALASYLKIAPAALIQILAAVPQRRQAAAAVAADPPRKLGVRFDLMPRRAHRAMAMSAGIAAPLPASINLIGQMRPIRDQGFRGTCVAHASTAVAEQYFGRTGRPNLDLSRQFVYWDCKQHDGNPNEEGTFISIAMPLLQSDGACLEADWPYDPNVIPGDEGQGPPPANAGTLAAGNKIPAYHEISATSILDLKGYLAAGSAIAFSIPVFDSWYKNAEVTLTGEIVNPIPGEPSVGGHAMCLVGYIDDTTDPSLGGGGFTIRNSWDSNWAAQPVTGVVGYGTIPYSYLARFGEEAFCIP